MIPKNSDIVYKVVKLQGERMYSSDAHYAKLEYRVNKWTRPTINNSKIFCFADLKAAMEYYSNCYHPCYRVYEAIGKNVDRLNSQFCWAFYSAPLERLTDYWKNEYKTGDKNVRLIIGASYRVCDSLKLIKRVDS